MYFKKIYPITAICVIGVIVMLLKRCSKKDRNYVTSRTMCNSYGMRVIENPFEPSDVKINNSRQPIVVKNPEFKKWKVYENDILSIVGILVVIIIVIGVSIVSFNSRQQQENALKVESQRYEITVLQTLENIENNTTVLSERTDSIKSQIKEGIDNMKDTFTKFQKAKKKKK